MQSKMNVKDLDLYYGDFQALHNINLDIRENEILSFIGPSGCGKSTFLKCLNRMNDLVVGCRIEGEITLDGEDTELDIAFEGKGIKRLLAAFAPITKI